MIVILDYKAGNVKSVQNAIERLGYACTISRDTSTLLAADKVIIPGVGEASSAMKFLKESGLDLLIPTLKQPVLGICLGLQILCAYSEEGDTKTLGIFPNRVKKFKNITPVPHMGWNNFTKLNSKMMEGINTLEDVYYVHSFYAEVGEFSTAICNYGVDFSAVLECDNFYATQFHPEKSGTVGERILKNFLAL